MSRLVKQYCSLYNVLSYAESNLVIYLGLLGDFKIKITRFLRFQNNKLIKLFFYKVDLSCKAYHSRILSLMLRIIKRNLTGINSGFVTKFVLIGVGFKMYTKKNFSYLKLGYSHLVTRYNPLYFKIKRKKRKGRFSILSTSYSLIKNYSSDLMQLKKPGVYTGKGIRIRKLKFQRKSWKKSSY